MLTVEHLERFHAALRDAGAPLIAYLEPGLSPDQIRAAAAQFPGLALPEELLLWWGWHNGAGGHFFAPERCFSSVEMAVDDYAEGLETGSGVEHPALLPVSNSWPSILVECVPESPSVGRIFVGQHSVPPVPQLPSVGALIEIWTSFLERGIWSYRDGQPYMDYGYDATLEPKHHAMFT